MSDEFSGGPPTRALTIWRLTRGVFWRGDDWVYDSPVEYRGLSRTELRNSLPDVQRATIRFWFAMNLRPYDLSGGPWFGFGPNSPGWGQGYYAPSPVTAAEALDSEFGDILSSDFGDLLASELPGQWMWNAMPSQLPLSPTDPPQAEVNAVMLSRLAVFEATLGEIADAHGRIGHNSGEAELTFTQDETREALELAAETRKSIERGDQPDQIARVWKAILPYLNRLGAVLAKSVKLFLDGGVTAAGGGAAYLLWKIATAYATGQEISAVLQRILTGG